MKDLKTYIKASEPGAKEIFSLYFFLAAIVTLLHINLVDQFFYSDQKKWHNLIINGDGYYPDQYRILTYYIAQLLISCKIPFHIAYVSLRFLFTFLGACLLHIYLGKWFDLKESTIGCLYFFIVLPVTFIGYEMQPTDPLNFIFFLLGYTFIRDEKNILLAVLIFISMLNRETTLMLIPVFFFYTLGRFDFLKVLKTLFYLTATAFSAYLVLRYIYGLREPYVTASYLEILKDNVTNVWSYINLLLFFNVGWVLAFKNLRAKPLFLKRSLLMVPIFFILHLLVGRILEIRLFLPLLPIFIPLVLFSIFNTKKVNN